MAKSVDEYLNEVDYSFKDYIPSEGVLKFINFIQMASGDTLENKTPLVHLKMCEAVFTSTRNTAVLCHRGIGKCLDINTIINTPLGRIPLENIQVGDVVYDRNLEKTRVTYISPIYTDKPCYRITLQDGSSFIATHDHKHILLKRVTGKRRLRDWQEFCLTTEELLEAGLYYNRKITERVPTGREVKWYIPTVTSPIEYPARDVILDPYTLGYFLGDGTFSSAIITCHKDDAEYIIKNIPYEVSHIHTSKRNSNVQSLRFSAIYPILKTFQEKFDFVKGNKFIPAEYKENSTEVRLALLQGLLDSDGTIDKGGYVSFCNISEQLCLDVVELVRGLGGKASISAKPTVYNTYYAVSIYLANVTTLFKLPRKQDRWVTSRKPNVERIGIASIEKVEPIKTKCIQVDSPTHSYLINDGYITHNTSVFAEWLFLYAAAFGELPCIGKVEFAVYIGDSIENGVKSLRKNIEYRYQNSEFLQRLIPNKSIKYVDEDGNEDDSVTAGRKITDVRLEFVNLRGDRFVVKLYGAKTGLRGAKEYGKRPTLAIVDDIISDEDARSDTVIKTIEDTIHKAVKYALSPVKHKVIWLGTPFNAKDPLYKIVESGAWEVACYPVCEKFPCTKEEFKGSWEDRFSYEYVKDAYEEAMSIGKIDSFYQELMLRITSKEDLLIPNSSLVFFNREQVLKHKDRYNFYITTDLATSAKKNADFSVISVWAYSNNGDYMLVDGWCDKTEVSQFINKIFEFIPVYNPIGVGIEVTGQQAGFISWLRDEMLAKNIYFNFLSSNNNGEDGIRPTGDKFSRFILFKPRFDTKKVWIANEMKDTAWYNEFEEERSKATKQGFKSKHDDVLDSISMLGSFDAFKPNTYGTYDNEVSEITTIRNTVF